MRCDKTVEYNGYPYSWLDQCGLEQGHEGPCNSILQPAPATVPDKLIWKTDESGYYHSANTKGFLVAVNSYVIYNSDFFEVTVRKSNPNYNFFFTVNESSLNSAKRKAEEVVSAFTKMLETLEGGTTDGKL